MEIDSGLLEEHRKIGKIIDDMQTEIVDIACRLVRTPSVNHPPDGDELACQELVAELFRSTGLQTELYYPEDVPGFRDHPQYFPGRDYKKRPNVIATRPGSGGGKSLLLSGHIDTVPYNSNGWSMDPFAGHIYEGKLYGLGSFDMKGGIAAMIGAALALKQSGSNLRGDLFFETVVDEEFAGVNGTLAGRLHGKPVDAAIIPEPSSGVIHNGVKGGMVAHINLSGPSGILIHDEEPGRAVRQLAHFLRWVDIWRERRRNLIRGWQTGGFDPVPVWVTKIQAGGWGYGQPITVPGEVQVELYWQLVPGEEEVQVKDEFHSWLQEMAAADSENFPVVPGYSFPLRFMPASEIPADNLLVQTLSTSVQEVTGKQPQIFPLPAPSDLYLLQRDFHVPSVHYGPGGANAHAADEHVVIQDIIDCAKVFAYFILDWCG